MSKARITVTLTEAQAYALVRLAECAANTYDDALGVLDNPSSVRAGYTAIDKLNGALHAARSTIGAGS